MKRRTIACLVVLAGLIPGLDSLPSARPAAAQADGGIRPSEAIVLPGAELGPFHGASEAELWAWSWQGGSWKLIAEQLDELSAEMSYVALDDGLLGENDELVLMLDDVGEVPPEGARPPAMPADAPRAVVSVSDPLDASYAGQIHLFRAISGPEIAIKPRVTWDAEAREIVSEHYRLGPADATADGYFGIRSLHLPGVEEDLVDRLKLRGKLEAFGSVTEVDEESLAQVLGLAGITLGGDPIKAGPLRAVLGAGGGFAYDRRFGLLGGVDDLAGFGGAGAFGFTDARISLDFSPAMAGASYHDANLPAGVPIDGSPDSVPDAPVPAWREVHHEAARLSLLTKTLDPASAARAYYRDDTDGGPGDTGDGAAYADLGVTAPDFEALVDTGFPGDLMVLPAGREPSPDALLGWRDTPVTAAVVFDDMPPTPTPVATATLSDPPTAVPTSGPERTPTLPTGPQSILYLPFANHP